MTLKLLMLLRYYQINNNCFSIYSRWLTLILISFFSIACSSQIKSDYLVKMPFGDVSISPIVQTKELTFFGSGTAEIVKTTTIRKKIKMPLDIVLLYDRTSSMKDVIDESGDAGNHVVSNILEFIPDTRFAVASIADYTFFSPDIDNNKVWQLHSDFNNSPKVLQTAIKSISMVSGGDNPEAYTRGFYEASKLNWRLKAKKLVIFFGDSTPHQPDPGLDNNFNTPDDLNWASTIELVKNNEIQIIGIHTNNYPEVLKTFEFITTQTNGQMFLLDDAKEASEIIKKSIYGALVPEISLQAFGNNKTWVQSIQHSEALFGDDIKYNVKLKLPDNTPPGVYPIYLKFSPNTLEDFAKSNIQADQYFTINVVTGWYNNYWVPLIPLFALILSLFYFLLKAMNGCSVTSSTASAFNDGYSLTKLLIDILFIVAILGLLLWGYLYANSLYLSEVFNHLSILGKSHALSF